MSEERFVSSSVGKNFKDRDWREVANNLENMEVGQICAITGIEISADPDKEKINDVKRVRLKKSLEIEGKIFIYVEEEHLDASNQDWYELYVERIEYLDSKILEF